MHAWRYAPVCRARWPALRAHRQLHVELDLPAITRGSRVGFEKDGEILTDVVTFVGSDPETDEWLIQCEGDDNQAVVRTGKVIQKVSDYVDRLI